MIGKEISVVLPCFNEGETIYKNLEKICDYLANRFEFFEIIAVNDGSLDNTASELERAKNNISNIVFINSVVNEGKGSAVKKGVLASQKNLVMFLDADLGIPIEQLDNFIEEIKKGNDIVIASRFIPGMKLLSPILWYRKIMEKCFRILRMIIINNYSISDTQCGFKVLKGEIARNIFPLMTVRRFAFDAELIYIASKKRYEIKELPVILKNPIKSSIRIYRDSLNMFFDLIKIRINSLKGVYKK